MRNEYNRIIQEQANIISKFHYLWDILDYVLRWQGEVYLFTTTIKN